MGVLAAPFVDVLIAGIACETVTEIEIVSEASHGASTFRVAFACDPAESVFGPILAGILANDTAIVPVAIAVGLRAAGVELARRTLLTGRADRIGYEAGSGLVQVEGRDLVCLMLGRSYTGGFTNQTSSDIVSAVAADAGLSAAVMPTTTIVGQYYELEHARSALSLHSRFSNAWELVAHLASLEGFDCWVDGSTLNFAAPAQAAANLWPLDVPAIRSGASGAMPVERLRLDCNLDIGTRPVRVRSWNNRQATAIDRAYPDPSPLADQATIFVVPNLDSDAALQRAISLHRELSRHRYVVSADMPGELAMSPRDRLAVIGTGIGLDGTYTIDTLIRRMDRHGFRQSFVARLA